MTPRVEEERTMQDLRRVIGAGIGAVFAMALLGIADAAAQPKEVVIGVTYPLTGSGAQVGLDAKAAMELAAEIVNTDVDLPLPLAKGEGFPHLGGAKLKLVFADHQSDPQKGRAEAERLLTQEKVVALTGTYQSSVAATVSQVAERYGVPFMSADNSSPSLHRRGLKWYFRASPHDETFTQAMFDFFRDMKAKGQGVGSVAIIHEDTLFGTDSGNIQKKLAEERGIKVAADIKYRANSPSLTSEVQQLKAANADVLLPSSYTTDAILLMKTMADLGYKPKAIVAQAAGFQEQDFFNAIGPAGEGIISRGSFATDIVKARPAIAKINEMFKAKTGKSLNDNTAREFTAILVLADAIDRAGSTDPEKIRQALVATDMPGEMTIMPWKRVRFDEQGQNPDANAILMQHIDGEYRTIWPAEYASHEPIWNMGK
jgi:branched-chain amino acid transport system substrate-binding protein